MGAELRQFETRWNLIHSRAIAASATGLKQMKQRTFSSLLRLNLGQQILCSLCLPLASHPAKRHLVHTIAKTRIGDALRNTLHDLRVVQEEHSQALLLRIGHWHGVELAEGLEVSSAGLSGVTVPVEGSSNLSQGIDTIASVPDLPGCLSRLHQIGIAQLRRIGRLRRTARASECRQKANGSESPAHV